MRSAARWFIRSLGSGRRRYPALQDGCAGAAASRGSILWPFHLPLSVCSEQAAAQSGAALPCFGLVRFGSVWGFFYPSSLLSFLFRTSRGLRSAARISAPALPWEEWLNGDSLLLLLFLCSYITSNPHSSRAEPAESSGAVLRCHGPGIYTAIQPPALPAPKPRGFRY